MAPPRKIPSPDQIPNPSGICQCGCGQPAPIMAKSGHGNFAGYAAKFIHGHCRRKHAHPTTLTASACQCGCGGWVRPDYARGTVPRFLKGHHMRAKNVSGPNSNTWKGGRTVANGYVYVNDGNKHIDAEHRVVSRTAGALTDERMIVHHRDGDKQNNDPDNLEPMTRGEHMHIHSTENWKDPAVRARRIAGLRRVWADPVRRAEMLESRARHRHRS